MPAHVDVAERAPEPVLDHAVHELLVAELHAVPHAIEIVRRVRHRFLPTCDDDLTIPRLDRLRGKHDGFQPRAADFIDRERGDAGGNSRLERRLPRGGLAHAALDDVAEDDLLDFVG
jgi:hypothetical protein